MTASTDIDDLGESLTKNVLFVSVTVHLWRGQRKIAAAEVKLGVDDLDTEMRTDPRWKLMPQEWASRFSEVENKIRGLVNYYTPKNTDVSMPLRGIDIIPRKSAKDFFDKLKETEDKVFTPLVDEFCKAWPATMTEIKDRLTKAGKTDVWGEVSKLLPTSEAVLRSKFRVEKRVVPISFDTKIAVLDGEAAVEFAAEVQQGVEEFKQSAAMAIVTGLQSELNDAVDNLVARIHDKGIIKGGTIGMVRTAFEKMKAFDFAATPEVLAKMKVVQEQLEGLDHTTLNTNIKHGSGEIADKLSQSLKALRAQTAEEAKALRQFGKKTRALDL